jgi:ketosteroid isomerase-like protein
MAATDTVKRYFEAMGARDLDAALALWEPGGIERIVGGPELTAPGGIREYFGELFAAFPDFTFEVLETAGEGDRVAVRWRARGTFAGPGRFQGF